MPDLDILPAELNITVTRGNEFGALLDFSIDLTNYSWTAIVFESSRTVSSSFPGGLNVQGATVETMTVTEVDAAAGQLNLSLTETQTQAIDEASTYRWSLTGVAPGVVTRTWVSGSFATRSP